MKDVGEGERVFPLIIGVILIILAFLVSGVFQWVSGLIGVVLVLTAIFGY